MQITPETLINELRNKNLKISSAESCTGGLIAKMITDVPGSSDVFEASVVCYANRIKTQFLGVDEDLLRTQGAVCADVAEQMAKGLCKLTDADICLSTTGIAGPGGGTAEKPVGLVYAAVYVKPTDATYVMKLNFSGSRDDVRRQTAETLFNTAYAMIKDI